MNKKIANRREFLETVGARAPRRSLRDLSALWGPLPPEAARNLQSRAAPGAQQSAPLPALRAPIL